MGFECRSPKEQSGYFNTQIKILMVWSGVVMAGNNWLKSGLTSSGS